MTYNLTIILSFLCGVGRDESLKFGAETKEWHNFIFNFLVYVENIAYLCRIMRRNHIVDKISEELKSIVPEAEVILYGSEARGEARPDSDFDVLILLPDSNDIPSYIAKRSEISGRMFELSLDLDVEISPLILPKNEWNARKTPFTINVINDGIRI